ncbi:MAG: hypothetical protein WD991_01970 [Candidatus Paceibacterota bacterium]
MKKGDVLNSPRLVELKRRRRVNLFKKISLFVFIVGAVVTSVAYISRVEKLNITNVEVLGNEVIDTESITEVVTNNVSGYYFWFLPKTNFLIYPKDQIVEDLGGNFKRLTDISLNLRQDQTLEVKVSERKGKYTWCGENLVEEEILRSINPEETENKCYFMDDGGYIFDIAPYFSSDVYFRFYGVLSVSDGEYIGNYFLPGKFSSLVSFKLNLESMSLRPAALLLKDNGDLELYLASALLPPNGPKIIFKGQADYQNLAENLQAALDTEPLKTNFKTKYTQLEYIDLRFGNRVYYKFKDGTSNE